MADESATHQPYLALRYADFRYYLLGGLASSIGGQMLSVAIGWQLYQLTRSALALGLVGLVQVVPVVGLALLGGQVADRYSRRRIVLLTGSLSLLGAALLGLASAGLVPLPNAGVTTAANRFLEWLARGLGEGEVHFEAPLIPVVYGVLFLMGIARAFAGPARSALLPSLVPMEVFSNAVTWNSSAFQLSAVAGPALGGLLLAQLADTRWQYASVYLLAAAGSLSLLLVVWRLRERAVPSHKAPPSLADLLAGVRFVTHHRIILATITLDLFAVLLGGATALLPLYADRILHVGPTGLGWLRAGPSIGALTMAMILAHRPPLQNAGPTLLQAVAGFGVCTIIFGFSTSFALSLATLIALGAFDNISVVVRHTLVQVLTPDAMRGRVSAVNQVFISLSNEVGELESGLVAAAFGPLVAVVSGGVGTLLVVLAVALGLPEVRRFGSLAEARPIGSEG
ncbi:MAG: MFS transporter [Fimbriimonadaceae bacterium]|nr:MFS transporter [Fimbriimonadaceae bacterium]